MERLSRYDTPAAIASDGRLLLPAQTAAGVALVKKFEKCARDGSSFFSKTGMQIRARGRGNCRIVGLSLKLGD